MHIFKRVVFVMCAGILEVLIICALPAATARADFVPVPAVSGDIHADTAWGKAHSPYILEHDIAVDAGATLTIGPGVKIISRGSGPASLVVHGSLRMEGSSTEPVDVSGIVGISADTATVSIGHAYFHDGSGIHAIHSDVMMSSSTIRDANGTAIRVDGGAFRGWNLAIRDSSAYGFLASAFAPPSKPDDVPTVDIHQSAFSGNKLGAAYDTYSDSIHLESNWWDRVGGPLRSGPNGIRGPVLYDPALDHDPTDMIAGTVQDCCSNVLFIPGLEGTRLYDADRTLLWEPIGNANILKLFLNQNGSSTGRITAGGPIDYALGLKGIYGSFMHSMDDLVSSGTITAWKPFGYDWRGGADQIAAGSLQAAVQELASTSKTGKVTIVAHSYGGLVAKYLIKLLSDAGQADIIDSLISVAVPYLGAPEALAGLLHGDHQSIAGGLFAAKSSMRDLGLNMPSAYGLLPSLTYFLKSLGPTVVFASTSINNANDQRSYVLDTAGARSIPASGDLNSASIGNRILFDASAAMHALLDQLDWPVTLARWAIVGWNHDTTAAIEYRTRPGCDGFAGKLWCRTGDYFHRLLTTLLGDGTVPAQSAQYGSDHIAALDLQAISAAESASYSHANILESSTTQAVVRSIITTPRKRPIPPVPTDVASKVPVEAGEPLYLQLTLNGDAVIQVRDETGADISTGRTIVTGSGEGMYTEVKLPYGNGSMYSVSLKGGGYGFFTLGVERVIPGNDIDRAQYRTEPMSPLMSASTTIDTGAMDSEAPIAEIIPPLVVDVDGNGAADYSATPDGNGLPGNASTESEADRIAREQLTDLLMKTDTDKHRNDPGRIELIDELFPQGTNGSLPSVQQKTPPVSGSASCP